MPSGIHISLPMVEIDPLSRTVMSACDNLKSPYDYENCAMTETRRSYGRCWMGGKQVTWTRTLYTGCTPRRLFGFRR